MNDLKEQLEKYCKDNDKPCPGVNMYVFGHNDMLRFAQQYFEKKVDDHLKGEKQRLLGNVT